MKESSTWRIYLKWFVLSCSIVRWACDTLFFLCWYHSEWRKREGRGPCYSIIDWVRQSVGMHSIMWQAGLARALPWPLSYGRQGHRPGSIALHLRAGLYRQYQDHTVPAWPTLLAGKEQEKQMGWDRETDHQDWRVADMFSHFHDYFLGIAPPPAPLNSRFFL